MTRDARTPIIRRARRADAGIIARIYNEGIRDRIATFETRERTADEVGPWLEDPRYPVLVAEVGRTVLGWISGSPYRARECYAGVAEFSVYVTHSARGMGLGSRLMGEFLREMEAAGFWKVLSRIFTDNGPSRALCARHGFHEVGIYRRHARLDGRWRDVVIVERLLGNPDEED